MISKTLVMFTVAGYWFFQSAAIAATQPPPDARELHRRFVSSMTAHQRNLRTVQGEFTFQLVEGMTRRIQLSWGAPDRFHTAWYQFDANDWPSMVWESAFDGTTGSRRLAPGEYINIGPGVSAFQAGYEMPIIDTVASLLRVNANPDRPVEILEAAPEVTAEGIRIRLAIRNRRARVDYWLAPELDYWPVRRTWKVHDQNEGGEVEYLDFVKVRVDGRTFHYPTRVVTTRNYDGRIENEFWQAVRDTLRINEPIDPARFRIEPWPSEHVVDSGGNLVRRAVDTSWEWRGKVGFPFDPVMDKRDELREVLAPLYAQASPTPTVEPAGRAWRWAMLAGGLLLTAAIAVGLRARKAVAT